MIESSQKSKQNKPKATCPEIYCDEEEDRKMKLNFYSALPADPTFEQLSELLRINFRTSKRRPLFFDVVDTRPDGSLRCAYSDLLLVSPEGTRMHPKFDEEHSMPQSFQSGTHLHSGRNMHGLFAVSKEANGRRGNKPFGRTPDAVLTRSDSIGNSFLNSVGGRSFKSFEPNCNKGMVYRAFLGILVAYPGCLNETRMPKVLLPRLIELAASEPVTQHERHRNFVLNQLHGTRNPFIDRPDLVTKLDFDKAYRQDA